MLFTCPQCDRTCKNLSGLKRHQNSVHANNPGLSVPVAELRRIYHPNLNGMYNILDIIPLSLPAGRRCDRHGTHVPPNALPESLTLKADDDWSPFTSRAGFELAEFMFADAELSQRKIDKLLELWAATLIPHGDSPPIVNHRDLHRQIDAIELGNIQWETARLGYDGPLPNTVRPPEWKTAGYDVWYRNPHEVIKNILARPDLDGHVDYAAYQEFNGEQRQYSNMMSGDWSWRQSVRFAYLSFLQGLQLHLAGCYCSGPIDTRLYVRSDHLGVRQNNCLRRYRSERLLPLISFNRQRSKSYPAYTQECAGLNWIPPNTQGFVSLIYTHSCS